MIPRRTPLRFLGLIFLLFALIPATVVAQQATTADDEGFIFQVNRSATVASGDSVDAVIVINADAIVDGEVTETLVVVNGTATVNGIVSGTIVVAEGALVLNDGATANDITLFRSDMTQAGGATVTGSLTEQTSYTGFTWGLTIFSVVFWIGTTLAILLAGFAIMALFGQRMDVAVGTITARPLESVVSGLVTWILLPVVALLAFITIIGIPIGLGLVFVVVPLLGLMGFMVASYWLGLRVVAMTNLQAGRYLSLVIGLVLLTVVGIIPWFGGVVTFFATLFGTGALVYQVVQNRRERRESPVMPAAPPVGGAAHV
jgi:large-conductance mechanosensitive channel